MGTPWFNAARGVYETRTFRLSKNHRDRQSEQIEFLVLHYTGVPFETTLGIFLNQPHRTEANRHYFENIDINLEQLCKNEISAHYVVTENGFIDNLVPESRAAYHAGVSYWNGKKNLNNASIGVEHVNIGYDWLNAFPKNRGRKIEGDKRIWCTFTEPQIKATIALCQKIIKKYTIAPYNVIGHSDVAPGRKPDPGPLFPWERLAEAGIGLWYDISESTLKPEAQIDNPVHWVQQKLVELGYQCPVDSELKPETKQVLKAFQMHFRPKNINGEIDFECMQILDSLCQRKAKLLLMKQNEGKATLKI